MLVYFSDEFMNEIKRLSPAREGFGRCVYDLVDGKNKIMDEIKYRCIYHHEYLSKGAIMIMKINNIDHYNFMTLYYTREKQAKKEIIKSQDFSDCVVCLSECYKSDSYKLTCVCKYSCHEKCLEKWLKVNNSCPFCKI